MTKIADLPVQRRHCFEEGKLAIICFKYIADRGTLCGISAFGRYIERFDRSDHQRLAGAGYAAQAFHVRDFKQLGNFGDIYLIFGRDDRADNRYSADFAGGLAGFGNAAAHALGTAFVFVYLFVCYGFNVFPRLCQPCDGRRCDAERHDA